ncbi:ribonucleoside-diphosphate reductase subunit alpha [Xanthomonas phage JGB6]|nr:ribonucleoside-diphosphate reductase subunit alpha [Xanthomonas phage JGB6]
MLEQFVEDVLRFLDNVLEDFIKNAPKEFDKAVYSAMRERSVGMGVMGFHSFLQANMVPFESEKAAEININVHEAIARAANAANEKLAHERGSCLDAQDAGCVARFSNMTAHAPTASISVICGTTSPMTEPWSTNAFLQKTLSGSFIVKNRYLEALLETKGLNTREIWSDIIASEGSVQHVDYLTDDEKAIFKTAFEIDQRWVVNHAGDRQPYVNQSQSVNLYLPANVHKIDLHEIHMLAWKRKVKSLYYCRSKALSRAEKVNVKVANYEDWHTSLRKTSTKPARLANKSDAVATTANLVMIEDIY